MKAAQSSAVNGQVMLHTKIKKKKKEKGFI